MVTSSTSTSGQRTGVCTSHHLTQLLSFPIISSRLELPGETSRFHGCGSINPAFAVDFVFHFLAVVELCKWLLSTPFSIMLVVTVGRPSSSKLLELTPPLTWPWSVKLND